MRKSDVYIFAGVGGILSILIIISIATTNWLHTGFRRLTNLGIFVEGDTSRTVAEIDAVRAFMIMGLLAEVGATICCVMLALSKTDKEKLVPAFFAIAGILLLIGMAVVTEFVEEAFDRAIFAYGYSYAFGWLACSVSFVAAAATLQLSRISPEQNTFLAPRAMSPVAQPQFGYGQSPNQAAVAPQVVYTGVPPNQAPLTTQVVVPISPNQEVKQAI